MMFGLSNPKVQRAIRALPGAQRCERYCGWPEGQQPVPIPLVGAAGRGGVLLGFWGGTSCSCLAAAAAREGSCLLVSTAQQPSMTRAGAQSANCCVYPACADSAGAAGAAGLRGAHAAAAGRH